MRNSFATIDPLAIRDLENTTVLDVLATCTANTKRAASFYSPALTPLEDKLLAEALAKLELAALSIMQRSDACGRR